MSISNREPLPGVPVSVISISVMESIRACADLVQSVVSYKPREGSLQNTIFNEM